MRAEQAQFGTSRLACPTLLTTVLCPTGSAERRRGFAFCLPRTKSETVHRYQRGIATERFLAGTALPGGVCSVFLRHGIFFSFPMSFPLRCASEQTGFAAYIGGCFSKCLTANRNSPHHISGRRTYILVPAFFVSRRQATKLDSRMPVYVRWFKHRLARRSPSIATQYHLVHRRAKRRKVLPASVTQPSPAALPAHTCLLAVTAAYFTWLAQNITRYPGDRRVTVGGRVYRTYRLSWHCAAWRRKSARFGHTDEGERRLPAFLALHHCKRGACNHQRGRHRSYVRVTKLYALLGYPCLFCAARSRWHALSDLLRVLMCGSAPATW